MFPEMSGATRMIKNNYTEKDAQTWTSEASKNDADQHLALRVYTSRYWSESRSCNAWRRKHFG